MTHVNAAGMLGYVALSTDVLVCYTHCYMDYVAVESSHNNDHNLYESQSTNLTLFNQSHNIINNTCIIYYYVLAASHNYELFFV